MLPKQHRLTIPIGRNTRSYTTPLFILKIRENNTSWSRFGFVVSKRVAKSAVVRNRTKRLFRSLIEQNLSHLLSGYDMLFIIRGIPESSDQIAPSLIQALKKYNLWQNDL